MLLLASLLSLGASPAPVLHAPVPGSCITSPFGPRRPLGPEHESFHAGIDLRAPAGTWILAAAAGSVAAIRRRGALGLEVDIRLADGRLTRYAHLGTVAPALAMGRRQVAQGERIGRAGRSGTTFGSHLHFEVHEHGRPVDPAPLLGVLPCK